MKVKPLSRVRLSATPWTVAYQASPSMGFSRQGYWSGVPLPVAGYKAVKTSMVTYSNMAESFLVASCLWKATFLSSVDIGGLNMSSSTNSYLSNKHELGPTLFQISCSIFITIAKTGLSLCIHFFSTHHSPCGWNNCSKIQPLCFPCLKFSVDSHYLQ